jgi:hypothetical protein
VLMAEDVSSVPVTETILPAGEKQETAKTAFTPLLPDLTYRLVP